MARARKANGQFKKGHGKVRKSHRRKGTHKRKASRKTARSHVKLFAINTKTGSVRRVKRTTRRRK